MSAALRERMDAEKIRAASRLGVFSALPPARRKPPLTPGGGPSVDKEAMRQRSIPALLPPPPTPEAKDCPARRKAESEGFAQFGKRTWFLVQRGESFRAVETLDDAPGWSLVKEMKR